MEKHPLEGVAATGRVNWNATHRPQHEPLDTPELLRLHQRQLWRFTTPAGRECQGGVPLGCVWVARPNSGAYVLMRLVDEFPTHGARNSVQATGNISRTERRTRPAQKRIEQASRAPATNPDLVRQLARLVVERTAQLVEYVEHTE